MQKTSFFFTILLAVLLSSCGSRETTVYEGIRFPTTSTSEFIFQEQAVPADCSAFSHVLMHTRHNSSGQNIAKAMHKEAEEKGANLVLIGMVREMVEEKLDSNRFEYYGPEYAYNFNTTWLGWKFGFDTWNKADNLIGLGTDSWYKADITFRHSLLIQAVFLRCGEGL